MKRFIGNVVIVKHNGTDETIYAHLSRIDVRPGQNINQGQTNSQSHFPNGRALADDVTDTLLREGIASFQKSFDTLTAGIAKKMDSLASSTR